jgi:hypothetical protein
MQRWDLTVREHHHRVEVEGSVSRTVRWYVDDELVATEKSADDNVQLAAEPDTGQAVGVRFTSLGRPKRVTLFEAEGDVPAKARAAIGTGGYDLDPEPGSPAALREQRIREHPWRHTAIATAGGVAKVIVPVLLGLLTVRIAVNLPWPDWSIPWPDIDLPSFPWPDIDLPSIPWPDIDLPDLDLPDWELPAWVRWLADKAEYVWPILLAFALAMGEVNRRRKQDALKAQLKAELAEAEATRDTSQPERREEDSADEEPEQPEPEQREP